MPDTAATIGFWQFTSAGRKLSTGRARPACDVAIARKSCRSLPAVKAPGTPAMTTARMFSAAPTLSSACVIASYMSRVSAFLLSGRFIRIRRIAPSSFTITWSVISLSKQRGGEGFDRVRAFDHCGGKSICAGRDVVGEKARRGDRRRRRHRAIAAQRGKRVLGQHTAAGGDAEQAEVGRGARQRAVRRFFELREEPAGGALELVEGH